MKMLHPGKEIMMRLQDLGVTQKSFSEQIGKRVSEINELIKWKRNITIGWDYILSNFFHTEYKYWILKQVDYDYEQFLAEMDLKEQFIERKREGKKENNDNQKIQENLWIWSIDNIYNKNSNVSWLNINWELLKNEKDSAIPTISQEHHLLGKNNNSQEEVFRNF
mgnify:CR=1 FL=1